MFNYDTELKNSTFYEAFCSLIATDFFGVPDLQRNFFVLVSDFLDYQKHHEFPLVRFLEAT